MISASIARVFVVAAAAASVALALSGCAPEPDAASSATPRPSSSTVSPAPTPSATPVDSSDEIALPSGCEQLYSAAMLSELQATGGPLNDPGITLYATKLVPGLEVLESGAPTLRCTWGYPSESGLATNVTIVNADQTATILQALAEGGYGCEDLDGGTICRIEMKSVDYDDNIITQGETQYLRGNGWVTTAWISYAPVGYTEDIVATLWG
ncbi:MAG: hypothetical protein NT132_04640 [Microbacterium sp.]|uniref:hypothetical protein n=1 Tax=Microbacterium sp. TaxID=51671 RepID=UPI002627B56C|nr:hypothetical protein [Microbacterium sp.]MCX6501685.1 hypothetical protein [Microbacterium sp.]